MIVYNIEKDLLKFGFTHRDENVNIQNGKYRSVFIDREGVEFVNECDVTAGGIDDRYKSDCSFFDSIKSRYEPLVTIDLKNNPPLCVDRETLRDFSRPPKPPEDIVDIDSYMEGYHQGLWKRPDGGVELRDHFAMAALTAIVSQDDDVPNGYAKSAYEIADAMLEARGKK